MQESLMLTLKSMGKQTYKVKEYQEDIFSVLALKESAYQYKNIMCIWNVMSLFNPIHFPNSILI
jgi:hypothetical protein